MNSDKDKESESPGSQDDDDAPEPLWEPKVDPRIRGPRAYRVVRTLRLLIRLIRDMVR